MDLTIVTYHYVRDLEGSRYPAIRGRRVSEFQRQLDFIERNYNVVRADEVISALRGERELPAKALWLTFDDGYIDHFENVFPLLRERGWQGSFFPPARSVLSREILDVNKIHFVLASQADPYPIIASLEALVLEHECSEIRPFDYYWQQHAKPSRYDGPEIVFIKRMLQSGIPEKVRVEFLDRLFRQFVSVDPISFAADLYVSRGQLQEMIEAGMYVGSHGDSHRWLDKLDSDEQVVEIDRSLEFLKDLGAPTDKWIMCYPYGANDSSLRNHLRVRGCAAGLTVRVAVASIGVDDPLMLPRINTNDMTY
jgi:peptidoglycan/xylan/chitin deacetylase (PgdA/CDA1 family)